VLLAGDSSSGIVGSACECRSTNPWTAAEVLVSRSGVVFSADVGERRGLKRG
jgi:hypothetical protein